MANQAWHSWMGETKGRWFVYFADGSKKITWAESEDAARLKAERHGTVVIVEPAPPMSAP